MLLLERDGPARVRQPEQLELVRLQRLVLLVVFVLAVGLHVSDRPAQNLPKVVVHLSDQLGLALTSRNQIVGERPALHLLKRVRLLPDEHVHLQTGVQNKHVPVVEGGRLDRDLKRPHRLTGASHLEQTRLVLIGLDLAETGSDTALHVLNALKVRLEQGGFVALNLAVLHRTVIQQIIEFDSLVGSDSNLVLGRVLSEPKVDIPKELVALLVLVRVQNQVRVAGIEGSVVLLGPAFDSKVRSVSLGAAVLYAPNLQPDLLSSPDELLLRLRGALSQILVSVPGNVSSLLSLMMVVVP